MKLIPTVIAFIALCASAFAAGSKPNIAIRVGNEKLVRFGRNGTWELYDMKPIAPKLHQPRRRAARQGEGTRREVGSLAERAHVKPFPEACGGKKGAGKN